MGLVSLPEAEAPLHGRLVGNEVQLLFRYYWCLHLRYGASNGAKAEVSKGAYRTGNLSTYYACVKTVAKQTRYSVFSEPWCDNIFTDLLHVALSIDIMNFILSFLKIIVFFSRWWGIGWHQAIYVLLGNQHFSRCSKLQCRPYLSLVRRGAREWETGRVCLMSRGPNILARIVQRPMFLVEITRHPFFKFQTVMIW